jgi:D-alanyl-D-alanine carboxypeptidase (penicillin-binding protein 5/6)
MEDITHETRQGTTKFTLTSTNKLLKQYAYTTGLKTGSTSKALYCISATASKDGVDLIAVVMGAPDYKTRFQDAQNLFTYGFGVCDLYIDENQDSLADIRVKNAKEETVPIRFGSAFRYLDTTGKKTDRIEKTIELPEFVEAPLTEGVTVGMAVYSLEGKEIGKVPIIVARDVEKASYLDYFVKVILQFLL